MKSFIWLLIFLAVVYFGAKIFWHHLNSAVDSSGSPVAFSVAKGEGSSAVADDLEAKHLIRSSLAFKINLKVTSRVGSIEAGDFQISPSMSTDQVIDALAKGQNEGVSVTLLEGWRDEEMASELSTKGIGQSGQFLKLAKQGYMFPDTYQFKKGADVQTVINALNQNFQAKYTQDLQNKVKNLGLTSDQGIILASIVEREARSAGVKQKVASILLKRLNMGMALDADATIQYALGYSDSEKSWWRKDITINDLQIASSYNTYTHPGLPPAPICNPGLTSIQAVADANPSTPYLYYYHDSQGNSYYEKTLDQHNADVAAHP
jgi:UPF0755 protein